MPIAGHPPHIYGPAARCKWNLRMGMRSASIYPASGWSLRPGHHGNPRAALLIRSKASKTGDRTILGGISRRGNRYLRTLFIQGARSVLQRSDGWEKKSFGRWLISGDPKARA